MITRNLEHLKKVAKEFDIPISLAQRICFSPYSFLHRNMIERDYKPLYMDKMGTFKFLKFVKKVKKDEPEQ